MSDAEESLFFPVGTHALVAGFKDASADAIALYAAHGPCPGTVASSDDALVVPTFLTVGSVLFPDPIDKRIPMFVAPIEGHFSLGAADQNDLMTFGGPQSGVMLVRKRKPNGSVALWIVLQISQAEYNALSQGRQFQRAVALALPQLLELDAAVRAKLAPAIQKVIAALSS